MTDFELSPHLDFIKGITQIQADWDNLVAFGHETQNLETAQMDFVV